VITDWLLGLAAAAWSGLLDLIPAPVATGWAGSVTSGIAFLVSLLADMGSWLPLSLIGSVMASYLALWLVAGGIVIGRMALSLFTGGGGSVGVS
jgi:hypothetical protein